VSGFVGAITGLPNLTAAISGSVLTFEAVTGTTPIFGGAVDPVYGLFDQGTEVLTGANSCTGFGFQVDEQIPAYPIEQGGFVSYNKVALPFGTKLQYAVYQENLSSFITELESLRADTNSYTVVTPVYSWNNCNITHWDTRLQDKRSVSMWVIDVWLAEIRQPISSTTSNSQGTQASATNTADPQDQAQQNTGDVQPIAVNATQYGQSIDGQINNIAADGVATPESFQTGAFAGIAANGVSTPASIVPTYGSTIQ
jgi:hypothetical protein